jgi:ribosomal protein S18 acetylase RimI-like enzyme
MKVTIRTYRPSDRTHLTRCLESLQDHLVKLDPWHRVARTPAFGATIVPNRLREVRRHRGFILVAVADRHPAGALVGWIRPVGPVERTEDLPTRMGFIPELAVLPEWRGKGIGTELLLTAERRFRRQGCDQIGLGVFPPNRGARRLYRRHEYAERGMWLVKQLGPPLKEWPTPVKRRRARRSRAMRPRVGPD